MNQVEITIHQHNSNCLVYYTIQIGKWTYDGDALNVSSALQMIEYNLQNNYQLDKE
jgi:hypothetical protein